MNSWFNICYLNSSSNTNANKFQLVLSKEQINKINTILQSVRKILEAKTNEPNEPNKLNEPINLDNNEKDVATGIEKIINKNVRFIANCNKNSKKQQDATYRINKIVLNKYMIGYLLDNNTGVIYNNKQDVLQNIPIYQQCIESNINCNFKILKSSNKYFLSIPLFNQSNVVGIDPGINTFLTCTDDNGKIIKIGTNVCQVINKIIDKIMIVKNRSFSPAKKKKIVDKYENNINNKIMDLHQKSINFLTSNYKTIQIKDFGQGYAEKNNFTKQDYTDNDIRKYLQYDLFIDLLIKKCNAYHINLKIIDETLTSKLCSQCGAFNTFEINTRTHKCQNCNFVSDRDVNASLNILNKNNNNTM